MASEVTTADMAAVAEKQKAYVEGLKQFVAVQGRKATPLFRALAPGSVPEEGAHGLVFAPHALAHAISDPQAGRALLFALKTPGTLGQSQIALRLKEASIEEMAQGEESRLT